MRLLTDLRLPDLGARVAACVPGVELVQIDPGVDLQAGLRGDALFTSVISGLRLEALLAMLLAAA